ncbi:MAG: hypothetical protein ACREGA_00315 [Candidatus Saccharimonadales bacterium]
MANQPKPNKSAVVSNSFKPPRKQHWSFKNLSPKQLWLLGAALVVVILLVAAAIWWQFFYRPAHSAPVYKHITVPVQPKNALAMGGTITAIKDHKITILSNTKPAKSLTVTSNSKTVYTKTLLFTPTKDLSGVKVGAKVQIVYDKNNNVLASLGYDLH